MLDAHDLHVKILATDKQPRIANNIKLYSPASLADVQQLTQSVRVYDDEPSILELENVYFDPKFLCLYDRDGAIIQTSRLQWGQDIIDAGPDAISPPSDPVTIEDPLVYLCDLRNHWGHLLTDGISRMWARSRFPELANLRSFVVTTPRLSDNIVSFLYAAGLDPWRNIFSYLKFSPQILRFRKIYIPAPSFSLLNYAHTLHTATTSRVAERFLRGASAEMDGRPVYLSRPKAGVARAIRNENELEHALRERNFRIVQPEDLSLEDQILLVNRSAHLMGCWGSAFYNMLFLADPSRTTTHTLCPLTPYKDFVALDAIVGHRSNYVHAVSRVSETAWDIDVGAFLRYVSGI